ncbi:metallophosphoesterase [Hymenobacter lucidus]|uniref:Metallophosphoesterase n=1 Tax=Hymenobacter lucidus TaxID=2880930 RepID=A0ABS8ATX0_9BACT|nr:metallophosphoesterase [Hymenobacter lucidus]MCB2409672.1 metallophosphoesterase [Hymenobacter lucidus]
MNRIITSALFVVLLLGVDWYVFQAVRTVSQGASAATQRFIAAGYWLLTVISLLGILWMAVSRGTPPTLLRTYLTSAIMVLFVSKFVVVLFLLVDDAGRLVRFIASKFGAQPDPLGDGSRGISRSQFINRLALLAGGIPFAALIWGMVKGATDYQVKNVVLKFPNLPASFDGFKLLQISDLHTGSFNANPEPLHRAVALINKQQADLVFMTGDLVNNIATEVEPHIEALAGIQSKLPIYSVLGNHDYADYVDWSELGGAAAKKANLDRLKNNHAKIGWKLLLDESHTIERGGEKIAVLGVQNWGAQMRFPKYGNLAQAHAASGDAPFKILLSHDPSHWEAQVLNYPDIDLTLSGHTHGMQFGVNLSFLKWSPVQYVYKQWAGLYNKGKQYLYVNTGLGFIGYPGRVGFLPEITVFELRRA